ncbi:NAD(P)H-binding protein [Amycolatopsis sp. NBC_00355]|uniref:NAD(P)H-binding protein n=1 Tax=Amycolatopsis sp. NBC_00355 TaxID=2975957 RepID=UPI002E255F7C
MTILVTGATGSVGRLVVDELLAAGEDVRALTVDPERAKLPEAAEVVVGSLARPDELPLGGIDAVYLAPMARTVRRFCELAADAGIERVVALSGSSIGDGHEASSGNAYAVVEAEVGKAGFAWTFLRPGSFMDNTLDWAGMVRAGEVAMAYGDSTQTPIALGDIAAVAARVLTTDGHVGATYVLSGPEALSLRGQVATLAAVLGTEIQFRELTPGEQRGRWLGYGVPERVADWLLTGFESTTRNPEVPTGVVEELSGRPGTTYAEWVAARREHFA